MTRNWPEEVLNEILSWLPVKPLLRFRCVSKAWLQLLSNDPTFIQLHLNRFNNPKKNLSFIVSCREGLQNTPVYYIEDYASCDTDKAIFFKIPFTRPQFHLVYYNGLRVVDSCNGMLCLTYFDQGDQCNVHIWNPLIGDYITIPCPPISFSFYDESRSYTKTNSEFGFAYDQESKDYKVIRFVSSPSWYSPPFQSHVSVYTLGTDSSWRTLEQIPYSIGLGGYSTAFVNEALHWFSPMFDPPISGKLVSFDIKDEVFREIPQPSGVGDIDNDDSVYCTEIGELGGLLCMFCNVFNKEVQIWMMKAYGVVDSWTQQFRIGVPQMPARFGLWIPLAIVNDEEIIFRENFRLFLYSPRANSITNLKEFPFEISNAHTYSASLVSPKIIDGSKPHQ